MCPCASCCLQEQDSKDNKFFLDSLYHDLFYKDIDRRVYAHGVQVCLICGQPDSVQHISYCAMFPMLGGCCLLASQYKAAWHWHFCWGCGNM